jgi:ABC-type nitrate/sulfonate/bicarbonate transport system substrate-binding protein
MPGGAMTMRKMRSVAIGLLSLSLSLLSAAFMTLEVRAATVPGKPHLRIGYGTTAGAAAPLWVAKDKGYFDEVGVNVEIVYVAGYTSIQGMLAGELQGAYGGCAEVMTARKAGSDLVIIGTSANSNLYTIVSRREITEPKQLIGKRVAISRLGDTSHLSTQFALKQAGIDPQSVTYVQVGSTPARLAALQSGTVDAALQAAQNVSIAKQLGLNILINLFDRRIPYCTSGVGVSKAYLESNAKTLESFMRALGKGIAFVREANANDVKAIMAKYMRMNPEDKRLVAAYEFYAKQFISRELQIDPEGIRLVIEMMGLADKSWLEWRPEQFYDDSIVKKLDKDGYWQAVYKQIR